MGAAEVDFEEIVIGIVERHVPDLDPESITRRASRRGRYLSLTVTFEATSREQLDALCRELSGCERVSVVL